jgi:hypothetical protein
MEIKRVSQIFIGNHEADSNSKEVKVNPKSSRGVADAIDSFQNNITDGTSNTMTAGESSSSNDDVSRYRQQITAENSSSNNENNVNQPWSFSQPQKTASKAPNNLGYHPFQHGSEERSKRK